MRENQENKFNRRNNYYIKLLGPANKLSVCEQSRRRCCNSAARYVTATHVFLGVAILLPTTCAVPEFGIAREVQRRNRERVGGACVYEEVK